MIVVCLDMLLLFCLDIGSIFLKFKILCFVFYVFIFGAYVVEIRDYSLLIVEQKNNHLMLLLLLLMVIVFVVIFFCSLLQFKYLF